MRVVDQINHVVIVDEGSNVLALGIALIVLPGPAFLVIPGGLAILAIEIFWAKRWLRSTRAVLPCPSGGDFSPRNRSTLQEFRRNTTLLFRRVCRTPPSTRKYT